MKSSSRSRSPKQLLILGTVGGIGGTPRVVLDLTRELRARGHDVTTLMPAIPEATETVEWFAREGVAAGVDKAVPDASRPVRRTFRHLLRLLHLARRYRPDAVNIHYPDRVVSPTDLLAIRLATGLGTLARTVVTVQHPSPFTPHRTLEKRTLQVAATLCDRFVVSTPYLGDLLRSARVPKTKLCTVPLGVPPAPPGLPRARVRQKLGLTDDEFLILAVARLEPTKGLSVLCQAFGKLRVPGKRLWIIGKGSQHEQLAREAQAIDARIQLLGPIDDLAPYYAAADLFALPSEEEGFGLVFAEAATYGLPSVAARAWAVPYVIEHEKTGLLVPPRDPLALADALARLASDRNLLRELGDAARRRAAAEFTAAAMAASYEAILFD